jgi:hypothetical protein
MDENAELKAAIQELTQAIAQLSTLGLVMGRLSTAIEELNKKLAAQERMNPRD